jgi:hypothetical protein
VAGGHRFRRLAIFREILEWSRRARTPLASAPGCTTVLVDGLTGVAHCVSVKAFAAGHRAGDCYVALCGARVLPERLTAPARYHCPACERAADNAASRCNRSASPDALRAASISVASSSSSLI